MVSMNPTERDGFDFHGIQFYLEEIAFFTRQMGIQDEVALKTHIINVAPYACIRGFDFLHPSMSKLHIYDHILDRGSEGAILLDIDSCLGADVMKAIEDGFPDHNIIASDIKEEGAMPDIQTLRSPNDLHGRVGVIHASKPFHLFDEEKQLEIARALGGLLSCESGSTICGTHTIALEKGIVRHTVLGLDISYFCHSRETWIDLWNGVVFEKEGQYYAKPTHKH
ncbi:hypothetical protein BDR07DRAFT_1449047 [Suillus spraguei]|nr:hypothetical protein BDR07DRAFT_1449047 [Suillus spraguei]